MINLKSEIPRPSDRLGRRRDLSGGALSTKTADDARFTAAQPPVAVELTRQRRSSLTVEGALVEGRRAGGVSLELCREGEDVRGEDSLRQKKN